MHFIVRFNGESPHIYSTEEKKQKMYLMQQQQKSHSYRKLPRKCLLLYVESSQQFLFSFSSFFCQKSKREHSIVLPFSWSVCLLSCLIHNRIPPHKRCQSRCGAQWERSSVDAVRFLITFIPYFLYARYCYQQNNFTWKLHKLLTFCSLMCHLSLLRRSLFMLMSESVVLVI